MENPRREGVSVAGGGRDERPGGCLRGIFGGGGGGLNIFGGAEIPTMYYLLEIIYLRSE